MEKKSFPLAHIFSLLSGFNLTEEPSDQGMADIINFVLPTTKVKSVFECKISDINLCRTAIYNRHPYFRSALEKLDIRTIPAIEEFLREQIAVLRETAELTPATLKDLDTMIGKDSLDRTTCRIMAEQCLSTVAPSNL